MLKAVPGSMEGDRKGIKWLLGTKDGILGVSPVPIVAHWHWLGSDAEVMWQSLWEGFASRMGMVITSAQPGWH